MTEVTTLTTTNRQLALIAERFESKKDELQKALVDISADHFIRAVMTSAQINPEIQGCSWQSLWISCMKACRDGLLPDGVEGAIVPYKSTASWLPMVTGKLRQFRRSGNFKWVTAGIVREGELLEHWISGSGPHFKHIPGESFTAPIKWIYALATTKDGGEFSAVLSKAEADKIRAISRATREDAPWQKWPEEMYKKTALHRLAKVWPSARDLISDDERSMFDVAAPPAPQITTFAHTVSPGAGTPDSAEGGEQGELLNDFLAAASSSPEAAAYQAGIAAKEKGATKKAMPGEFRDASQVRLQLAWLAGLEDKPMPTFETENRGGQNANNSHD